MRRLLLCSSAEFHVVPLGMSYCLCTGGAKILPKGTVAALNISHTCISPYACQKCFSVPCCLCRYGRDLAEDDLCRVEQGSSMHGTPDASFVTARTVRSPGRSQSSSQSAWGRGARARLLAPVQSASPFIGHQARWGRRLSTCCRVRELPAPGPSCWRLCREPHFSSRTMSSQGGCCHVRQTHSSGCTVISGMPKLVRLAKQLDWHWLASACHLQPAVNWLLAIPCRGCTCLSSSATTS